MIKLIKTNLVYLFFRRIFLLAAAVLLYLGIRGGTVSAEYGFSIEHIMFCVLIIAAVTLLTAGRENSDGTLRGKLILGYSRGAVFGSFVISSVINSIALYLIFSLPYFIIGSDLYAKNSGTDMVILASLIILAVLVLVTVGSVCLALCIPLMPVAAVALLAAAIGFVMLNEGLDHKLYESKETTYVVEYTDPSQADETDKYPLTVIEDYYFDEYNVGRAYLQYREQPNPYFVGGTKRTVYRTIFYSDPYTQLMNLDRILNRLVESNYSDLIKAFKVSGIDASEELSWDIIDMLPYYPLYSLGLSVILVIAGLVVFKLRNVN